LTRLHIETSFEVADSERERAPVMAKLHETIQEFEKELKAATGVDIVFDMRVVRHKGKSATPSALRAAE
jgi:hypothetical protein